MISRHLVLGTAGHIDHGKSALVRALTGVDPDRLKEEQRRGITIELGFAKLALDGGRVIGFVDVPGHERFVRHMVAGATGVDAVLLVVAADQGVQPQTREHLEICSLLGIRCGIVVLTKCDLVDAELADVVGLEVGEAVAGTFLEAAPMLRVSARTGEGLDPLCSVLSGLFDRVAPRPTDGPARLHVDRSFVLRGFGSVVTGTLVSGRIAQGEEVEVQPGGLRGRIRGLHVHGEAVVTAEAGQRVAINLQGLDTAEVPRGATICHPGTLQTTRNAWARLRLLPSAPQRLARGGPVRLHHGTTEGAARFRVLGREDEGTLHVELHLAEPHVLAPGDRFILRRSAPVDTVGGGVVLDAHPPRKREASAAAFDSLMLRAPEALGARLSRAGVAGRESGDLVRELGLAPAQLDAALRELAERGEAVRAATVWIDGGSWRRAELRTLVALDAFHAAQPLAAGASREALRGEVCRDMLQAAWRDLLEGLRARGELRLVGERVARASHRVVLEGVALELSRVIERGFLEAGLEPPALDDLLPASPQADVESIVALLVGEGRLVRIQDGRLFHAEPLARLRQRLREFAGESRTIDVGAFKQLAGVTRKNAIPLLEQFDAERVTRRVGNEREILVSRAE